MSEHSDAPHACLTASRVFAGDTVSRVFISEPVSRVFVGDQYIRVNQPAGTP